VGKTDQIRIDKDKVCAHRGATKVLAPNATTEREVVLLSLRREVRRALHAAGEITQGASSR
jgi:hypothetical protein